MHFIYTLNVSVFNCVAQFEDPFEITIDKTGESIELYVSIPSNHYIYSDKFVIEMMRVIFSS